MPSIQSDKGYLRVKYYLRGKAQYEYTGLKDTPVNRKKLEYRVDELKVDLRRPIKSFLRNRLLLDQAFQLFYFEKPKISLDYKSNFEALRNHLSNAFNYNKAVQDFTIRDVIYFEDYLKKLVGENSVASYFIHFRVIFNFLKQEGYIEKNIIPKSYKIEQQKIEVIPLAHRKKILNELKQHNEEQYTFVSFLDMSGKRQKDAIELQWEDFEWKDNTIFMRNVKGKRRVYVYMFPEFKKLMRKFWRSNGQQSKGKVFTYKGRSSLEWWNRTLKRLKLPHYKMHSLRRTFASDLLNNETSIYDTMKLTGHRDIRTLDSFYAKLDAKRLSKEVEKIRGKSIRKYAGRNR